MEHHFNIDIAKQLGIEEAIFIHNMYYWITKNAANKKLFFDGSYWTYNTKQAYAELFIYMSESKVKRLIAKLEKDNIIKTGNYNTNKMDRTLWYSFTKYGLKVLKDAGYKVTVLINEEENAKNDDALGQSDPMEEVKTDSCYYKDNNKDINKETLNYPLRVLEKLSVKYKKGKELTEVEVKYYLGMEEKYPRIMKMDEPLLYEQYMKVLKSGVSNEKIKANLEAMQNYKPLNKRTSALLTLKNFIRIDKNNYNTLFA